MSGILSLMFMTVTSFIFSLTTEYIYIYNLLKICQMHVDYFLLFSS